MNRHILIFLLLISGTIYGQTFEKLTNTSSCKAKIIEKNKSTNSLKANFTEETYSSMFNNPKKAKGTLNYKKSKKIRWEHTSPKKKVILIKNGEIRMLENGKEIKNATSNVVAKKVQTLMLQMLNGDFIYEKDFKISYYHSSMKYKLVLTPKSSRISKYISKIVLYLDKKTMALDKMKMIETKDDKVIYSFSNVRFNEPINESKFSQF